MRLTLPSAALRLLALACLIYGFTASTSGALAYTGEFLFFSAEDLPGLRSRVGNPEATALMGRLNGVLKETPQSNWQEAHQLAGRALLGQLSKDKSLSGKELSEKLSRLLSAADHGPGLPPLCAAASSLYGASMAFDLGKGDLEKADREQLAKLLLAKSRHLATLAMSSNGEGAPGLESAAALAASGLAALCAAGPGNSEQERPARAHATACHNAIRQLLEQLGDKGWPRESLPSLRQALAHGLGGFMLAWKHQSADESLSTRYGRPWAALYATLLIPPRPAQGSGPESPQFGPMNSRLPSEAPAAGWESNAALGGDTLVLSCLADAATRAALLWSHQACFGAKGDGSLDLYKGSDALFALLGPLLAELPLNPAKTLPRIWKDERAGLYVMRNHWEGPEDSVVAIHANTRPHPHLPSFADAGSFRLNALGGRWAVRRAQDAADLADSSREKENTVVIPGTHGWLGGKVTRARLQGDGSASLTLNLDAVHTVAPPTGKGPRIVSTNDIGIRATRCVAVDYSGRCGAPVMLVVMDRIQNGPTRRWLMHTAEKGISLRPDGFALKAANGATLRATILSPARPRLSVSEGRWTDTIAIDGESNFFVIITVQPAGAEHPRPLSRGNDLETTVRLGDCQVRFDGQELAIR